MNERLLITIHKPMSPYSLAGEREVDLPQPGADAHKARAGDPPLLCVNGGGKEYVSGDIRSRLAPDCID